MLNLLKKYFPKALISSFVWLFFAGCIGSKVGSADKAEETNMKIMEKRDVVNFSALKEQSIESLASRGMKSRGLPIAPMVGSVLSLATNAIKNVIAKEEKKYTASYEFALTDLYFYDQLSNENAFDPVGMQFAGFRIARTFVNKEGKTDTAFTAAFSLDTTNAYEILNNSTFRLKLDDFSLKYAKAKVAVANEKKLNMDIEITFRSSYVNQQGVLFDNITLGKFYLFIRSAPLDKGYSNYGSYYQGLKGQMLSGRSFIVPRSFGYHMEDGEAKPGYSQGAYTITVSVTESSKNAFIKKVISDNTNMILDIYKEKASDIINSKLPGNMQ